jgi:DNA polymerase-3 subunit alpha
VTPKGVRFGLTAIKNVGEGAIASILGVRASKGTITSLHSLCDELDLRLVNKRVLESLVKAGAFDAFGANGQEAKLGALRARLMATIDLACEHGARRQRDRDLGQAQLFGGAAPGEPEGDVPSVPVNVVPWTEAQQLAHEKEALGLYWTGHPIDRVAEELKTFGAKTTAELAAVAASAPPDGANGNGAPSAANGYKRSGGVDVAVGGIVAGLRQLKTRKGDRMAVITLEDPHGSIEVVVFPEAYAKALTLLEVGAMVVVKGKVELDDEAVRMMASDVLPIDTMREKMSRQLAIKLTAPPHGRETFEALADLFARHRGDRRVILELELRGAANEAHPLRVRAGLAAQVRVQPSERLASEVERICGPGTVVLR